MSIIEVISDALSNRVNLIFVIIILTLAFIDLMSSFTTLYQFSKSNLFKHTR